MKTEFELWRMVDAAKWTSDHDYERIREEWTKLPKDDFEQLETFINKKHSELSKKFHDAWLGNDDGPGIDVSDDSWMDLTAEVVGRGEMFYNHITVDKLREMADNDDYEECFLYCLHVD